MALSCGVHLLLLLSGCMAASQRDENVYVSGITNACSEAVQLRSSSGLVSSPGWPFQYPSKLNCSWNIRARPGDTITVSFLDFSLQSSQRCSSDYLLIDGLKLCGSSRPAPYTSTSNQVSIHFHSDGVVSGKGFRLEYSSGRPSSASCAPDQFHCSSGRCVPESWRCNSQDECGDGSDEELCMDSFTPCSFSQFPCVSRYTRIYTCLPQSLRCDGSIDCQDLSDEVDCDVPFCGERLKNFFGSFSSPNYPDFYPPGSNCTWVIDTGDHRKVILRFTDFKLDGTGFGDFVKVFDGLDENPRRLLRVLTALDSRAPVAVVSSSGQLRVHFYADKINAARGFNATYQVEGFCLPWELPCGDSFGCYSSSNRCDGYWHCPNGRDEANCSWCQQNEFPCSRNGACYPRSDRCNYQNRCPNGSDEKNCFSCQPGNFHCKNNRCVFESWVCDAQDDCGDGSDEESCPVTVPTRVITAAVIGSLICGLLLVIALGCTCKLYSLRMFERRSFETQLSRVEAELLRREAPPSYGQLIAQGLIPPVEDFPVCSGNQASVLENLRLAVRSQLGFPSLRFSRRSSWGRWFSSRRRSSVALVSSELEAGRLHGDGSDGAEPLLQEAEPEGAVGGATQKVPMETTTTTTTTTTSTTAPRLSRPVDSGSVSTATLQRLASNLHRLLNPDRHRGNGPDEHPRPQTQSQTQTQSQSRPQHQHQRGNGTCDRCGKVHTAAPDACSGLRRDRDQDQSQDQDRSRESSDDELLLL